MRGVCLSIVAIVWGCAELAGPADLVPDATVEQDAQSGRQSPTDALAERPVHTWTPQAWEDCEGQGAFHEAGPTDYRDIVNSLAPGDTLRLRPGEYPLGLSLSDAQSGAPGQCVVIEPVDPGNRPRFIGTGAFNIVTLQGASWLKIRGLDLDGRGTGSFGVAA